METPSINTLLEIAEDAFTNWTKCKGTPWAVSELGTELLFCICLISIVLYLLIMAIIAYHRLLKGAFKGPFYNCVFMLALGDIGTLLLSSRANMTSCVLRNIVPRYLAWESLTLFCIELIYGTNLVISTIRLDAVLSCYYPTRRRERDIVLNLFLVLIFLFAITWSFIWFKGLAKRIWFPTGVQYKSELLFPVSFIRTPWTLTELTVTFILYCGSAYQLRRVRNIQSAKTYRQEYRLLLLAVLIFICELFFFYCIDWIGSFFGIGSNEFNGNLSYFGKPVATGITPLLYVMFSTDVRYAVFFCYKQKSTPNSSAAEAGNVVQ